MKTKSLFFLFFFINVTSVVAQKSISISLVDVQFCVLESENEGLNCDEIEKVDELLKANPDETMFTHVTDEGSDAYYVMSTEHTEDYLLYNVKNKGGEKFTFMIDAKKSLLKIIARNEGSYLVFIYTIGTFM